MRLLRSPCANPNGAAAPRLRGAPSLAERSPFARYRSIAGKVPHRYARGILQERDGLLGILFDDGDDDHADLAAAGVPVLQLPHDTGNNNRSALLRDPDGNLVEIVAKAS